MSSKTVQSCRSLFLSDFHIGSKRFDAEALLDFLRHHECEFLYLVGDIIDGWKLQKRWYWHETISAVFDELIRKVHNGTRIIYITGNHDEAVRFLPLYKRLRFSRRLHIQIRNKTVHETLSGQRLLILHGDQFDRKLFSGSLSRVGDQIYDWWLEISGQHKHMNIIIDGKAKPFSMAKFLNTQGQRALNVLNNFESLVVKTALAEKADGIICGHTHIAALKHLHGVLYGNCGSWLRGTHTALAETQDGNITLLEWPHHQTATQLDLFGQREAVNLWPDARRYRHQTLRLIDSIRRTFVPSIQRKKSLIDDIRSEAVLEGTIHWQSAAGNISFQE